MMHDLVFEDVAVRSACRCEEPFVAGLSGRDGPRGAMSESNRGYRADAYDSNGWNLLPSRDQLAGGSGHPAVEDWIDSSSGV